MNEIIYYRNKETQSRSHPPKNLLRNGYNNKKTMKQINVAFSAGEYFRYVTMESLQQFAHL